MSNCSEHKKEDTRADFELPKWLSKEVIVYDWCEYNGEVYFAVLNWEESEKRKKPILDLAYCATKAMNGIFLKRRVWSYRFVNYLWSKM